MPSTTPSFSPTLSLQSNVLEVVMYLRDSNILTGASIILWEGITATHIRLELSNDDELEQFELMDLEVGTNIISQDQVLEQPSPPTRRALRRILQQTPQSPKLKIVFDTALSYRSPSQNIDVKELVGSTFNSEEKIQRYVTRLQRSGDATFSNISQVDLEIDGVPQIVDPPSNDDGGIDIAIIAGAAAGGAVVVLAAAAFFVWRKKRTGSAFSNNNTPTTKSTSNMVTNEILVDHQDDISTLGDPMYSAGGMLIPGLEKDETVAASIISGDYEYAKAYGANGAGVLAPSVSTNGSKRVLSSTVESEPGGSSAADLSKFGIGQDSLFSDDSSFEEQFMDTEDQFEVIAPAGKLGMVIDTPSGGVPVVHAIRDTSVLADQVRVGDRLISVDDEDTTCMTAMQVSKLISTKADNPSRVLVFARTRARANTDT
jgi:hypothetical protein